VRVLTLTLPLLLLLLGGCGGCDKKPPAGPGAPELAKLIQLQGQVTVQQDAASRPGRMDEPLYPGETVVTGPGSTARVRYINGTEVEVAENSRFRVNGSPGAPTLEVQQGRVVSSAPKEAAGGLTVTGPFGRAEMVTAAAIVFDLRDNEPKLTLQYGDIRVIGLDGQAVPVVVGQEIVLDASEPKPPPMPVVRAQAIVFTLESEDDKVRVKGAQEAAFTELARNQPRELGPGSAFEVPAKASARLSSNDLQVNLAGDSAGTFQEASRQGEQRTYALRLSRGKARLQFGAGQHSLKLNDGRGEVELKVAEQSTIALSDPQSGSTVQVLTGKAELVADGKSTVVQAGEQVNRASGAAQAAKAPAPALMLPPDLKTRVFSDAASVAGIQVPASTGGPLRVEVSPEPSFSKPLLAGRVGTDWVRVEPPPRGELHWRFLGEDGAVRTQGSARFELDRGRSALASENPKAEVMETGLNARVLFQSAAPALNFTFSPRDGARSYQLRLYRAADAKTPILQRVTNKAQYTLEPGSLGEGRYLWYVAALGPGGDELAGGRMNKLELVYDNERRGLALSRPRPGEKLGREVPVEGVVPIGSRLFLNGQPVALDAKGRFSQRLPPTDTLVFRLVSGQSEAYWVRTLRSPRP
jgi:ferric-dicitrate binding protein FerR (iron transport regulator)